MRSKSILVWAIVVCLAVVGLARADWPQQAKLLASDGDVDDHFGESVSVDGEYAIVGAHWDDPCGPRSGSAYIFHWNGTQWIQQQKLMGSDIDNGDRFGTSVSINGDYALVGAISGTGMPGWSTGTAYIFYRSGTTWLQQVKLVPSGPKDVYFFGESVSINADYAIVGASGADANGLVNSGSAYIFKRSGASWTEQAKLTASDYTPHKYFGNSVSISGDYVIVGAYEDYEKGTNAGAAYIFKRSGNIWSEVVKLTALTTGSHDWFGYSVFLSGDYAIVGAYLDDNPKGSNAGSAYIFKRSGASWTEQAKLTASDGDWSDWFGYSVSLSGDYAIVGAYDRTSEKGEYAGSAYIFKRSGNTWSEVLKLTGSDGATWDVFGYSVSISSDYAIVGAHNDDDKGTNSGSAYMFKHVCPTADLSGDCFVDFVDFAIFTGQWLQGD